MKLLHSLSIIIILGAVLFVAPQHAHASSNGCNSMVNLNGTLVWNEQKTTGTQDFWAGDTVTIYLQIWAANGKVTVRAYGPNGDTFFTTFPATYTYKFDQAGSATFNVANLETCDRARITCTATCNGYSSLPIFTERRMNIEAEQTAA